MVIVQFAISVSLTGPGTCNLKHWLVFHGFSKALRNGKPGVSSLTKLLLLNPPKMMLCILKPRGEKWEKSMGKWMIHGMDRWGSHFSKLQTRLEVEEGFSDDEAKMQSSKLWPLGKCWGWKHWNPWFFGWQKPWFSWFPVEILLKPIHSDLTFLVAADGPLFSGRDGKQGSGDGWRRRESKGLFLGLSFTGVPNGYFNGENEWKWWSGCGFKHFFSIIYGIIILLID